MAYFVADEKLQGYYVSGGVTINIVKYHFECDDAASLPAQTAFISSKNIKISMASTAHTIDTDALYKMDSSGAWVQQSQPWQPLADYSVLTNKPQINGHTLTGNQSGADLGLQNTLTFDSAPTQSSTNPVTSGGIWTDQQRQDALQADDRAALVELVDGGAKNLCPKNTETSTTAGAFTPDFSVNIPAGDYVISMICDAQQEFSLGFYRDTPHSSGNRIKNVVFDVVEQGARQVKSVTLTDDAKCCAFYHNSAGDSLTNVMICTQSAWAISQAYQQYRPSWQAMYDMILALQ